MAGYIRRFRPRCSLTRYKRGLENPFVAERGLNQSLEIEGNGVARLLDTPIRSGDSTPSNPAPALGQHTDDLLSEIGYDMDRVKKLRNAKII